MSRANLDRIRSGLTSFERSGGTDADFLHPDFELHQASSIVDTAGVFRGRDALSESLRELSDSFEDLRFEPEQFIEAPSGEIVVLIHAQARGRGSGVAVDNRIAWVWTFSGELATRMVVYEEPADALEAVGLPAAPHPRARR